MDLRRILLCTVLVLGLALAGCEQLGGGGGQGEQNGGEQQEEQLDLTGLIENWAESAHGDIVLEPAEEENCVRCHDGGAFALNIGDPAQLEREFPVATDCRACHTGRGAELLESGEASIPTADDPVEAGKGALCMTCHNERRRGNIADPDKRAPHYASQAGPFTGTGGIRSGDMTVSSTAKHASLKDACVSCHMENDDVAAQHSFAVDDLAKACRCHDGLDDINREAKEDYDGDGQKEGFQDEVDGLVSVVASAVLSESKATTLASAQGRVLLKSGEQTVTTVADDVYAAAYNVLLVRFDSSHGIHNPAFTVSLLQGTYQALTGNPVPNAKPIAEGSEEDTAGGSEEETQE